MDYARTIEDAYRQLYPDEDIGNMNYWDITANGGTSLGNVDERKQRLAQQWWSNGQLVRVADGRVYWLWVGKPSDARAVESLNDIVREAQRLVDDIMAGGENPKDALRQAKAAKAKETGKTPMIKLGTILALMPQEVTDQIMEILNNSEDTIDATRQLKAILTPHREVLEQSGVVPEYLAYMIIYAAQQQHGQ